MSALEEHYGTLPDLGDVHIDPEAAARERVQRAEDEHRTRLAIDVIWHDDHAALRRRDRWTAAVAWLLAGLGWWVALAGDWDRTVLVVAAASVAAVVTFAVRSGRRLEDETRHRLTCPAVPR